MTRFDPTPGTLRMLGFGALATVLGLGLLAARIPQWQEPAMSRWTATIPVEEGARGIEPGGRVLVGGHPVGHILSVEVMENRADTRGRPLVGIDFELPSSIELGRDAVVRRSVGIAGTNGVLDIPDPGSRDRLFTDDDPRVLAIDTSPPSGGAIGVLIGRRNGERIEAIADAGERFGVLMPPRLRAIADTARRLTLDARDAERTIIGGFDAGQQRLHTLSRRFAAMVEEALDLPPLVGVLQHDLNTVRASVETSISRWSPILERIVRRADEAGRNASAMQRHLDDLGPTIESMRDGFESAMLDAEAASQRLALLAPEAGDGLRRTLARMVLAGGQLRLALDGILPLALEAITTSPDRRSVSRRRLLESIEDTVDAVADVQDAARRLDMLATLADALPSGEPVFDARVSEELDARLAELDRLLEALSRLVRTGLLA